LKRLLFASFVVFSAVSALPLNQDHWLRLFLFLQIAPDAVHAHTESQRRNEIKKYIQYQAEPRLLYQLEILALFRTTRNILQSYSPNSSPGRT
jgi:hypothetical protein